MKKWLVIGFILAAHPAIATSPCPVDETYVPVMQRYERGSMFQITRCDTPTSIIAGTFHSDSERLDPLYNRYLAAMMQQELAAFEINETPATSQRALQLMLYPTRETKGLEQLLTTEEYAALSARLQQYARLPEDIIRRLRPWAANALLDYPAQTRDGVMFDFRLQQEAKTAGKNITGLESIDEQLAALSHFPEEKQVALLKETIRNLAQLDAQHEDMFRMFTAQDLSALQTYAEKLIETMPDKEYATYFREKLIHERNRRMTHRMEKYLRNKKGFYAVGALHLLGDEGMLPLLEKQGYHISIMNAE